MALDPMVAEDDRQLRESLARIFGLPTTEILGPVIVKHSLDARRRPVRHVYSVELDLPDAAQPVPRPPRGAHVKQLAAGAPPAALRARGVFAEAPAGRTLPDGFRPVVVGAGPAGLFAALGLARLGAPPLLLERGRKVEDRSDSIDAHWAGDALDPENNVQYGEGGSAAFSDGKIYTRSRGPQIANVLKELVDLGASPRVLIEARPHIGADCMQDILRNFRTRLVDLGVEMRYRTRVVDLIREGDAIIGVVLEGGEEIRRGPVLMATGHSARDSYEAMVRAGVPMEAWPTAMGLRIEHPQELIDRIQYKIEQPRAAGLPPADYHLAFHGRSGRGAYTFCMCPGGRVISASSLPGHLVVNGMSNLARANPWASAGIVVQLRPKDYEVMGNPGEEPLLGFNFLRQWEERAFELGGGGFVAPAQRVEDFVEGRISKDLPESTYRPGIQSADLRACLPEEVANGVAQALGAFGRRLRGFDGPMGVLIGVETRTSAPVRMLRNDEGGSYGLEGFYPIGEGAGHAGGIVSAAVDGVRTAEFAMAHARRRVASGS